MQTPPHLSKLLSDWHAERGYADVGEVRLHYIARGTGPLVLLLHGFPECWYAWRHQVPALGDQYCVVAPDLRGYNLSDKPPHPSDYRLERLVADVLGLIRYFGAKEAALVGHDWGAAIAWSVAQRAPKQVRRLAALQVPPFALWRENLTLRQLIRSWYVLAFQLPWLPERVLRTRQHALLMRMLRSTAMSRGIFTDEDLAVYQQAWSQPGAVTASINYYRANLFALRHSRRTPNGPVSVPTLFIYGEQDVAVLPETVRHVHRYVTASYCELRLQEAGHWVQHEAPAQVNTALRQWLDEG